MIQACYTLFFVTADLLIDPTLLDIKGITQSLELNNIFNFQLC